MLVANPIPKDRIEALMEAGLGLPGPIGHAFQKRLKSRYTQYSRQIFDDVLNQVGPGDICVDFGANVGSFTRLFADRGATVHAFEPDPETFERLQESFQDCVKTYLYQSAVGASDGDVQLFRAKEYEKDKASKSLGSSIARPDRWAMNLSNPITVNCVDCLDFLKSLPKTPTIVKMDIEGAEWDILDAITTVQGDAPFDYMFVETHERFAPWKLMPRLRRLRKHFSVSDAPFVNLYWQ
jgi:FkbM family methyltransferase